MIKSTIAMSVLAFGAASLAAQDTQSSSTGTDRGGAFSARVSAGTLGIGPELGYRFSETAGVRVGASLLSVNQGFESDGIDYDGNVRLRSAGAMFDLYPFGGGFRLSAGGRINGNRVGLVATPTQDVEIDGEIYSPAEVGTLTGRATTKSFAPALTLGYGGSLRRGFVFGIEAGVLFQGALRVEPFTSSGSLANDPDFRQALEDERLEIQEEVDEYKLYPIVQLSLGYRF